jgi:hypothetical protein
MSILTLGEKMHNNKLCHLYISLRIAVVVKPRRLYGMDGRETGMEE